MRLCWTLLSIASSTPPCFVCPSFEGRSLWWMTNRLRKRAPSEISGTSHVSVRHTILKWSQFVITFEKFILLWSSKLRTLNRRRWTSLLFLFSGSQDNAGASSILTSFHSFEIIWYSFRLQILKFLLVASLLSSIFFLFFSSCLSSLASPELSSLLTKSFLSYSLSLLHNYYTVPLLYITEQIEELGGLHRCVACHGDLKNDASIQCDQCFRWYHAGCASLSPETLESLRDESWNCNCRNQSDVPIIS